MKVLAKKLSSQTKLNLPKLLAVPAVSNIWKKMCLMVLHNKQGQIYKCQN